MQYSRHQCAKCLAIAHHAAQRRTADVHAVIGALAGHEIASLPLIAGEVIGKCDLHRRVDRLGAGVAEEDVVETLRGECGDAVGECERAGMTAHEGRREVERLQLLGDCSRYFGPAVTSGCSEEPGAAVKDLAPRRSPIMHAARTVEQAWITLELAIVGEGHPMAFQTLGRHFHVDLRASRSCEPSDVRLRVSVLSAKSGPDLRSRRPNSMARIRGSRAVAPCTAIEATTSPCRLRTGTATQATPSTYSSLSTAYPTLTILSSSDSSTARSVMVRSVNRCSGISPSRRCRSGAAR